MVYNPRVIPIRLFPGDWCLNCIDPHHPTAVCHMLEMVTDNETGEVAIEACGCDNSVSPDAPGKYVVQVTQVQKE